MLTLQSPEFQISQSYKKIVDANQSRDHSYGISVEGVSKGKAEDIPIFVHKSKPNDSVYLRHYLYRLNKTRMSTKYYRCYDKTCKAKLIIKDTILIKKCHEHPDHQLLYAQLLKNYVHLPLNSSSLAPKNLPVPLRSFSTPSSSIKPSSDDTKSDYHGLKPIPVPRNFTYIPLKTTVKPSPEIESKPLNIFSTSLPASTNISSADCSMSFKSVSTPTSSSHSTGMRDSETSLNSSSPLPTPDDPSSVDAENDAVLTCVVSQRGEPILYIDSYLYRKNRASKSGSVYYACRNRSCPARGILNGSFSLTKSHNHGGEEEKFISLQLLNQLKTEVKKGSYVSKERLYYSVLREYSPANYIFRPYITCQRSMKYWAAKSRSSPKVEKFDLS